MIKIGVIALGIIWLLLLAGVIAAAIRQIDSSGRR